MSNRTRALEDAEKYRSPNVSRAALKAQQRARIEQAARIAAARGNVKEVLELTEGLPTDSSGTIYGPDGTPLLRPIVEDFTKLEAEPGDQVKLYAEDILKRAARMQRDGASLKQIAVELDIEQIVPLSMLQAALDKVGHPLLAKDIAAGVEPEESKIVTGYQALNPDGTDAIDDAGDPEDRDDSRYRMSLTPGERAGGRPN